MRAFAYERPTDLAAAVALLAKHGPDARVLAGGTDLIIRLRDRTLTPAVVVDVKRIPEFAPSILELGDTVRISAGTTMTDIVAASADAGADSRRWSRRRASSARSRSATGRRWSATSAMRRPRPIRRRRCSSTMRR